MSEVSPQSQKSYIFFKIGFLFHFMLPYDSSAIYSYFNGVILKIMVVSKLIVVTRVTCYSSYKEKYLKCFLP